MRGKKEPERIDRPAGSVRQCVDSVFSQPRVFRGSRGGVRSRMVKAPSVASAAGVGPAGIRRIHPRPEIAMNPRNLPTAAASMPPAMRADANTVGRTTPVYHPQVSRGLSGYRGYRGKRKRTEIRTKSPTRACDNRHRSESSGRSWRSKTLPLFERARARVCACVFPSRLTLFDIYVSACYCPER